jgi:putative membrane protein
VHFATLRCSAAPFCTARTDNRRVIGDLQRWFDPEQVDRIGETPDYRFSLANERTFLAWIRTGLALIAGGLACAQFLPPLPIAHLREGISIALLILGGVVALRAVDHWARTERAMRLKQDLPRSRFPAVLAIVVMLGALLLVAAVLIQALR